MRLYTDVGSTKASERTPTCTKQGFILTGARLTRGIKSQRAPSGALVFAVEYKFIHTDVKQIKLKGLIQTEDKWCIYALEKKI